MEDKLIYTRTLTISDTQTDRYGRLKPAALLEITQEAAATHAGQLGAGREALEPRNLFWAIVRQNIVIRRLPREGETVVVETWPAPPTRTAFPRHIEVKTTGGEPLFQVAVLWLFMDRSSRAMVLPGASGVEVPGILRGTELPLPKGIPAKTCDREERRTVRYSELDQNGHLNNTKYANWMEDLLPSDFHKDHQLRRLGICYMSEALEGQELTLSWEMADDTLHLSASRQSAGEQQWVFTLRAEYEVDRALPTFESRDDLKRK